ncbi:MAG: hypothetical protein LBJ47_02875 [Tannerella sp.]|jgi:hypothetical protein|nr:hypothetical protein [Tannerella sp.]
MKNISRKKFLNVCGSIVAGGAIAGVSGVLLNRTTSRAAANPSGARYRQEENTSVSPYRQVASFEAADNIQSLAQHNGTIYLATPQTVSVYDSRGTMTRRFAVAAETVRDMAAGSDGIYLLHPAAISVYSHDGQLLREWSACSELSNYCSLALSDDFVFVTDMDNKNICKYTREGNFVTFINSPGRFIIPSLTFGIECVGDLLYCSNSGRHQVEKYTLNGEYIGTFGKAGGAPGLFNGCCNPVHISCTPGGDIITSEKGIPRISCYGGDGIFRGILLDGKQLGGGYTAYDVKVWNDRLFVAGKKKVTVFRYDETLASAGSACASCGVSCPLRRGGINM